MTEPVPPGHDPAGRPAAADLAGVAGVVEVASLVAELVCRADAAAEQARQAEDRAGWAEDRLRVADLEAELYRQLRARVRRWLAAGCVPDVDEEIARFLCEHPRLAELRAELARADRERRRGGGR